MKAFLYSVVGAIISGIVVFLVQQYLSEKPLAPKIELTYSVSDNVIELKKADLAAISKEIDGFFDRATVALVSVKNTGNQPIDNQEAFLRAGQIGEGDQGGSVGAGIVKYGTLSFPGKDSESVKMQIKDGKVVLKYSVLNPGEMHKFWVIYNDIGQVSFSARKPGLALIEAPESASTDADLEESTIDTLGRILGWGVVGLIIFLGGMLASAGSISSDLKGRGYDLGEILKKPKIEGEASGETENA